jgi:hypothetical protein
MECLAPLGDSGLGHCGNCHRIHKRPKRVFVLAVLATIDSRASLAIRVIEPVQDRLATPRQTCSLRSSTLATLTLGRLPYNVNKVGGVDGSMVPGDKRLFEDRTP